MSRDNLEPTYAREQDLFAQGYKRIAGCDEAGRGPLAGPVLAAAVILPTDLQPHLVHGLRDSKQLTESQRDHFYHIIMDLAVSYGVGTAGPREIDEYNILQASLLAMKRAVEHLDLPPDYVLVDGNKTPSLGGIPVECIVGGDRRSFSIAAASIVAKVVRDRIMNSYHQRFPQYGFDAHKGYPTKYHRAALEVFGASEIHRMTFAGVSDHLLAAVPGSTFDRLYRRFAARLTLQKMEQLRKDILETQGLTEAEFFVLRYRCEHLLESLRQQAIDLRPSTREMGDAKETLAAQFLETKGYKIWERNFRRRRGEIDIIANKDDLIVFVEVKSRTGETFGQPFQAVTKRKQQTLVRMAEIYLAQRGLQDDWNVRFDVISILEREGEPPRIEHIENAFRVD